MKRKILAMLLCLLMVSQCAVFAFAETVYDDDDAPTVDLNAYARLNTYNSGGDEMYNVPVIGYKIQWGMPKIYVSKSVTNNLYWDPASLSYKVNTNDPNPIVYWSLDFDNAQIATVTNLSNVAIKVSASFTPNEEYADVGMSFTVSEKTLASANENYATGQEGGSDYIVISSVADRNSVAEKLYNALNGSSTLTSVGKFTVQVSQAS